MLPQHNDLQDTVNVELDSETKTLNQGNEWLRYAQGGKPKTPYLQEAGRLKKKPKTIHVSAKQRRAFNG